MIQLTNQVYKADIFEKGRTFDKSLYYFGWFQFLQVLSYDSEGVEVSEIGFWKCQKYWKMDSEIWLSSIIPV